MLLGWYASLSFALVLFRWSHVLLREGLDFKDVLLVALLAFFGLAALIIAVLSPARYDLEGYSFETPCRVPKSRRVRMYSSNISAMKKSPIFKMVTPDTNEKYQSAELGFVPPSGAKLVSFRSIPFHLSVLYFCFISFASFILFISFVIPQHCSCGMAFGLDSYVSGVSRPRAIA